jgi:hypothetical protein
MHFPILDRLMPFYGSGGTLFSPNMEVRNSLFFRVNKGLFTINFISEYRAISSLFLVRNRALPDLLYQINEQTVDV